MNIVALGVSTLPLAAYRARVVCFDNAPTLPSKPFVLVCTQGQRPRVLMLHDLAIAYALLSTCQMPPPKVALEPIVLETCSSSLAPVQTVGILDHSRSYFAPSTDQTKATRIPTLTTGSDEQNLSLDW